MGIFNNTTQFENPKPPDQTIGIFGEKREPTSTWSLSSEYKDTDVINLKNIHQVYKGKDKDSDTILFDNFNFDIKDIVASGQFVSILGRSGCGKCLSINTLITIRNKKTKIIEKISINDFLKRLPHPK